ncbi:hypothetical protein D9619_011773 [Psilocybe cf. subviscida]|uniref:Amidohydrolase 3 domain-containing protein n=1 Tax=Psilocybe cf. subviscida TaxID=2480587 RepID=A0A8H5B087_9AGAR|nr:hypothetical protein D9619_011773 [Psilocybe cf. subviscida]
MKKSLKGSKSKKEEAQPAIPAPTGAQKTPSAFRLWVGIGMSAALLFYNSRPQTYTVCSSSKQIYTVDPLRPRVECISVKGTRIVDIGTAEDLTRPVNYLSPLLPESITSKLRIGPSSKVVNLEPTAVLVPGLADAHAHILENGYMNQLPLGGSKSVQEVIERIKAYLDAHPDVKDDKTRWIEGMGWDQSKWSGAQFPTAADLDTEPLLMGRLISLTRVDGHARWVSKTVLQLIEKGLPTQVPGGLIVRDNAGAPTGIFVDNAMDLVPTPEWSDKQLSEFFELTMKQALSYGLTSIHDAMTQPGQVEFFKKIAKEGKLPMRVYMLANNGTGEYWGSSIEKLHNYGTHGRLNLRGVKLFSDGALGSWGAALLAPYSDKPETNGIMLSSPEKIEEQVRQFHKDGWQTAVHCIGDRANHVVLDIYERILNEGTDVAEWRPRIEHAQVFAPEDLEKIGKLGVIASVQPTHAFVISSALWLEDVDVFSARRIWGTLRRDLISPQGVLPLGSDFPIEGVNPLLGFYAAVSKLSVDGTSPHGPGGWYSNERLTREQALKGMTLDAAYASFAEKEIGSLTVGKKADFVIFDRDFMTLPFDEILQAKVVTTVVDGEVAYGTLQ